MFPIIIDLSIDPVAKNLGARAHSDRCACVRVCLCARLRVYACAIVCWCIEVFIGSLRARTQPLYKRPHRKELSIKAVLMNYSRFTRIDGDVRRSYVADRCALCLSIVFAFGVFLFDCSLAARWFVCLCKREWFFFIHGVFSLFGLSIEQNLFTQISQHKHTYAD